MPLCLLFENNFLNPKCLRAAFLDSISFTRLTWISGLRPPFRKATMRMSQCTQSHCSLGLTNIQKTWVLFVPLPMAHWVIWGQTTVPPCYRGTTISLPCRSLLRSTDGNHRYSICYYEGDALTRVFVLREN